MQLIKTILPTAEPLSTAELKTHLVVEHTKDDADIARYGRSARAYCETFCRRQIVAATYALRLDRFWQGSLWLPNPPLLTVSSITYVDADGDTQTVATTVYDVDTYGLMGRVYLAYNQSWSTARSHPNSVIVTYVAGSVIPFAATYATNLLTWSGHTPTDGTRVRVSNTGGALPTGLSADTDYFVIEASGSTCKLATTAAGSAVALSDDGTGTNFIGVVPDAIKHAIKLLVADSYEQRRDLVLGVSMQSSKAVERLLWSERVEM